MTADLVVSPPLGALDMFVGRGDLDVAVTVGSQEVLTLKGDVGVSPLEQLIRMKGERGAGGRREQEENGGSTYLDGDLASEGRILVATFLGTSRVQLVRQGQ